jgi:hypothetical protein
MPTDTPIAVGETKAVPLPQPPQRVTLSASVAVGESGGGSFDVSASSLSKKSYAVPAGAPWSLNTESRVSFIVVTNTGTTAIVFTTTP